MAIQINLLQNQKDYNKLDNYFRLFRLGVAVFGALCMVTLIVVFALKRNVYASRDASRTKADLLQKEINALQDQEARIIVINEKMEAMTAILKKTPDYSREIETFLAYMPQATESGRIDRISLSENIGDITFSFPDTLELSRFLTTLESPSFQQNFVEVTLQGLELSHSDGKLLLTVHVVYK